MIRMTPTSSPTNCGLCVGKVPAEGASDFFCANDPATASIGTTKIKRPISIAAAIVVL